ncbi:hypothetical protein GCM10025876_29270 [Demequina litorisediminis]|uniref:Uncharacterized protein n=1 Tax=Demequina litorisediminis TaxID=1849022 RepID=A0ABQ6IJ22_9MICO|nr:hypothetical protein GCM10025876_29270 [Demequina litorisediminis]
MLVWTPGAHPLADILAAVLVLLTGVMSLAAGVGLLRFPDTLQRLHAGAKPQVLGVIVICIAIVLRSPSLAHPRVGLPGGGLPDAHAAHRGPHGGARRLPRRAPGPRLLVVDELADDVRAADRAADRAANRAAGHPQGKRHGRDQRR